MAEEMQVKKRTRPDRKEALSVQSEPGDNRKYLEHSMAMLDWPDVSMREPEQVKARIGQYFQLCADDDMKPSVAGMALAFGVDRTTLWKWANGVDSAYVPAESRNLIKKAYQVLNAQMENYMQNGKINPVAGIFLMKNNMGYVDKQEMVLKVGPAALGRMFGVSEAYCGDYLKKQLGKGIVQPGDSCGKGIAKKHDNTASS